MRQQASWGVAIFQLVPSRSFRYTQAKNRSITHWYLPVPLLCLVLSMANTGSMRQWRRSSRYSSLSYHQSPCGTSDILLGLPTFGTFAPVRVAVRHLRRRPRGACGPSGFDPLPSPPQVRGEIIS